MRYVLETIADTIKLRRKLLPLVEECGKLSGKDPFGWALLAKLVYACDQEMLQTISSRIQVLLFQIRLLCFAFNFAAEYCSSVF